MELWHLPSEQLWDELQQLSQEAPPDDPHERLLIQAFLKHAPDDLEHGPFAALLFELRTLGKQAPLKHRDFLQQLPRLVGQNREIPALQSLASQAELGDRDALYALIRASLDYSHELLQPYLENLRVEPDLWEAYLKLYPDSAVKAFRETYLPVIEFVDLSRLEFPPLERPKKPTPKSADFTPSWSLRQVTGLGRITLFSQPHQVFEIGMETIRSLPKGFLYTSYRERDDSYTGSGESRRIHHTRLADDLSYLVLQFAGAGWDLLNFQGKVIASVPAGPWNCYMTDGSPVIGGPGGVYRYLLNNLTQIDKRPVLAFHLRQGELFTLDYDHVLRHNQTILGQLPAGPPFRFSPDGQHLARLHEGHLEIYRLQNPANRLPANREREFSFSPDSQSLITIGKDGLTRWSLDGNPLAYLTEREASLQPLPVNQPEVPRTRQQMAEHDRFFDQLSQE
jgi:hypothetical protein